MDKLTLVFLLVSPIIIAAFHFLRMKHVAETVAKAKTAVMTIDLTDQAV